jgi:hypothetical protein
MMEGFRVCRRLIDRREIGGRGCFVMGVEFSGRESRADVNRDSPGRRNDQI